LKGCPLRCLWCANPESQLAHPQVFWDERKCSLCGACVAVCPQKVLSVSDGKVRVKPNTCVGCGSCAAACPLGAREMTGKRMRVDEVMQEVLEDRIFYGEDGGLTVSGGEPLMQADFTLALLRATKEAGITTAVETCGFAAWETLEGLAPYCDTFLYDIKAVDPQKHRCYTGCDNARILDNLKRLSAHFPQCDIWIRTPLIPGYNDSEEDMALLAELAKSVATATQLHLLPYHDLGEGKREQLGEGQAFRVGIPTAEHMERLREMLRSSGVGIPVL
ncbi:MAG: glycyl-radical enzyme activating protein, partial [Oscillospiraceae bacterium]|nr:glycyl-radical enzyme activating protein [Oscillospiraceae bacterium]